MCVSLTALSSLFSRVYCRFMAFIFPLLSIFIEPACHLGFYNPQTKLFNPCLGGESQRSQLCPQVNSIIMDLFLNLSEPQFLPFKGVNVPCFIDRSKVAETFVEGNGSLACDGVISLYVACTVCLVFYLDEDILIFMLSQNK